ncbi:hypothetical protein VTJ04DRAFT_1717 [Mycothermus thermophilus]|uniref:uncharacterized protein n=1 Tax=Humicola insolens TaxID=85995 RepID=UPI003741FCF2
MIALSPGHQPATLPLTRVPWPVNFFHLRNFHLLRILADHAGSRRPWVFFPAASALFHRHGLECASVCNQEDMMLIFTAWQSAFWHLDLGGFEYFFYSSLFIFPVSRLRF